MRKIKYILLLFLFFLPVVLHAYDNELAVTNGSSIDVASNDNKYLNSTAINEGIAVNQKNFDFSLDSSLLSSIMLSNPDIVFYDFIPSSSQTISTANDVFIGVTVNTVASSSTIRQVGFRVSTAPPTSETGDFTMLYTTATPGARQQTISVSTVVAVGFQPGRNYVQWYAQNDVNVDGNTNTQIVDIGTSSSTYIYILQPKGVSSSQPMIQANLYSPYGFEASSVTISMYEGTTTSVLVSSDSGTGKFSSPGFLNYKYTKTVLSKGQYTLWIEMLDNNSEVTISSTTFTVSGDAIPDFLPYPSPYNPKKGLMTIRFVIPDQASVTINIYDRAGKFVCQVLDSVSKSAGENKVTWNGKSYAGDSLANGVYICEIVTKSGGKENKRYKSFAILRK